MRTVTAGEQAILEGAHYATHVKVEVEDSGGTWRNLATLGGKDWNHSGSITQTVDQVVPTLSLQVWREDAGGESLSPMMSGSAYAGYVAAGQGVRVYFATVANNATPSGSDWKLVFDGVFDEWDIAGNPFSLKARDSIGAQLGDRWIKEEMELGSDDTVAPETVIQQILDAWTDGITLYTPTASGGKVPPYRQSQMSVLDSLTAIAGARGWVNEPRWDDGTSSFRLTFYGPDRSPSSTAWTWAADRYEELPALRQSRLDVRNSLSGWYTDATTGQRTQRTVQDNTSIAQYDEQWMEFQEADDSPIDTQAEMDAMLDAALSDLKDPVVEQRMKTMCFWPVQLGDYYAFTANDVHYDVDQAFGVTGFTHSWSSDGHVDTTMDTRGKPAGFVAPWIVRGGQTRDPVAKANAGDISRIVFEEDTPTEGQTTVSWVRGADVYEIWWYYKTLALPVKRTDEPYPDPDNPQSPDGVLSIGTDSLVVDQPDAGYHGYLQLEMRDETGKCLKVRKYELGPKSLSTISDLPDGSVIASALVEAAQGYGFTGTFSATATNAVGWTAGTLTFAGGASYSISSGSATSIGSASAPTFIYFDSTVSTTVLQTTTNWSATLSDTAVLMAVAWSGNVKANVVPGVGVLGLDGNAIHARSIQADRVEANTLTAAELATIILSAISVDAGTITAGKIQDSTGGYYVDLDATGANWWLYSPGLRISPTYGTVLSPGGSEVYFGGVVGGSGSYAAGGIQKTKDTSGGGQAGVCLTDGSGTALVDASSLYTKLRSNDSGLSGITDVVTASPQGVEFNAMATEELIVVDAGSTSATEQDWIEVTVGGNTGYLRVFASK